MALSTASFTGGQSMIVKAEVVPEPVKEPERITLSVDQLEKLFELWSIRHDANPEEFCTKEETTGRMSAEYVFDLYRELFGAK